MLDFLTASPSVGAWRHSPMTTAEIDVHPDADRIWATIAAVQGAVEKAQSEGFDAGEMAAETDAEDARRDERGECLREIERAVEHILADTAIWRQEENPLAALLVAVRSLEDVL